MTRGPHGSCPAICEATPLTVVLYTACTKSWCCHEYAGDNTARRGYDDDMARREYGDDMAGILEFSVKGIRILAVTYRVCFLSSNESHPCTQLSSPRPPRVSDRCQETRLGQV